MSISTTAARQLVPGLARRATGVETRVARQLGQELGDIARRSAGPEAFRSAAGRLESLASALVRTGRGEDARILNETARRLSHAGELHAAGHTHAAFEMLHARRKLGLANPEFQEALARGTRAEGLLAHFGTRTAAENAFDRAAARVDDLAEKLIKTGHADDARLLETFSDRLSRAGDLHSEGQRQAAFAMLHAKRKPGLAGQDVQEALARGRKAESLLETFGGPEMRAGVRKPAPSPGIARPTLKRPPVARPGTVQATAPSSVSRIREATPRPFSMPGSGLDLSGLLRALERVRSWLLGR
ncbi:MAG: hypothetical protein VKP72_03375 [bacterium]|nr:hypothetical protein [bacterium]